MRMVSKLHMSPTSVKRFKRVHVQHKAFVASNKPVVVAEETKVEEPVVEPVVETVVETEEVSAPKKSQKRKKVEEPIENNEENTENHE